MPKLITIISFLLWTNFAFSQNYTLKGSIQEDVSKRPIALANVYLASFNIGTATAQDGAFQLAIPDSCLKDTLVISAIGYKGIKLPISDLYPETDLHLFMQDSMFLLEEVVAFCYDYVEGLYWATGKNDRKQFLLTFVSKDLKNVTNFLLLTKGRLGAAKKDANSYIWKDSKFPGIKGKNKVTLKFFRCGYCPGDENITVTIDIQNNQIKDILHEPEYKLMLAKYFQELLDQTFEQGVNITQLNNKNDFYALPSATEGYTGKVYGYFESGQKGLRGQLSNGKKDQRWEYWYENGQKRMVNVFKNGVKQGVWVLWGKDGNIRLKNNWVDGNMEGYNFWWHENGKLKKISFYKTGVIQGKVEWEESGTLKEKRGIFENATAEEIKQMQKLKVNEIELSKFVSKFLK